MNTFKDNLKHLVKNEGITMAQLARATKIAPQTINNWVAGQEPRSFNQVKKIADYFEITLDELCFGVKEEGIEKIQEYTEEINAGIFEVVLRRIKK
ncbi:MAG: helix-turn-helix domain-containing protein [Bacteriovoracaceae bacterium]|jgi:transcriptional regulator with XRE-family HTH domain|nr:helix-turn-helix domain-containing protein [Bacteriovoracaceae bacterium]